jgi:hypothetical protein
VDVPWWWSVDDEAQLRHRLENVIEGGDVYELETVDHGVVVGYDGDRPVETAMSGLTRVGNHSKYGFGALRVKPVTPDETNIKKRIGRSRSTDKRTMTGRDSEVSRTVKLNKVDHIANNCYVRSRLSGAMSDADEQEAGVLTEAYRTVTPPFLPRGEGSMDAVGWTIFLGLVVLFLPLLPFVVVVWVISKGLGALAGRTDDDAE